MSLFVCRRCNVIENTALSPRSRDMLCSKCATGKWHGRFPAQKYDLLRDGPVRPSGFIQRREIGS